MTYKNKWDVRYVGRDTPWETGLPHPDMIRLFSNYVSQGDKVLEIGCGTGINAQWLHEAGYNLTAVDVSDEAIRIAKQKNTLINFLCLDFLNSENILSNYGAIFDCAVLQVLTKEERPKFVENICNHCRPGGYWINISCSQDNALEIENHTGVKTPPYLTAEKIISIAEPFFELIEMKRCDFYLDRKDIGIAKFNAWASIFKRRI